MREALQARDEEEAEDGDGVPGGVVRRGAGLILDTLEDLTEALGTAVPPMAADGRPRTPGG